MTNCKLIICCITSALLLIGCNNILEPVSLFVSKQDITTRAGQEEFEINIKSLTFKTAQKANNAPYARQLILTGSGSKARVLDEARFLKSNFPVSSSSPDYLLGIGDQISFAHLNEFETKIAQWPNTIIENEYLLGPGDELTFAQSNDINQKVSILSDLENNKTERKDELFVTKGTVGTNGNVLLFSLGNISVANLSLIHILTLPTN